MAKMPRPTPGLGRFLSESTVNTSVEDHLLTTTGLLLQRIVLNEIPIQVAILSLWVGYACKSVKLRFVHACRMTRHLLQESSEIFALCLRIGLASLAFASVEGVLRTFFKQYCSHRQSIFHWDLV